jgi:hypothetical protein
MGELVALGEQPNELAIRVVDEIADLAQIGSAVAHVGDVRRPAWGGTGRRTRGQMSVDLAKSAEQTLPGLGGERVVRLDRPKEMAGIRTH